MNQVSSAQNASIKMGGLTFTSTVNTFDDAIQGVDIDIAKLKENDVVDFKIENITEPVKESTQTFIDGFNKILSMIDSENRKIDSSLATQIRNELRKSINHQTLLSNGTLSSLSSAGITTDPKTGQLSLDERKFKAFLDDNSQGMDELLSGDNGILNGLISGIDRMLDSDGVIASRTQSLNSQESRIDDQQEALDRRMEIYERRVSAQYMQLEKIINNLSDDNNVILNLYR
jgi:flagellar hook-associated protein 2